MTDFDYDIGMAELREEHNRLENPQQNTGRFGDNIIQFPDEGVVTIRLLPPTPGKRLYSATRLHPINEKNYHCLRTLQNGKWRGECPICDEYNGLYDRAKKAKTKEDEESLRAQARKIKPYERYYYNGIVRKEYNKETQETLINVGPKIFPAGKLLHARILRAIFGDEKAEEAALGNVAHPINGRDFKVVKQLRKSPEGVFPNYDQSKFMEVSLAGTPEQIEEWMSKLHDLQALRDTQLKSYEFLLEQVEIFAGRKQDTSTDFKPTQQEVREEVVKTTITVPEKAPFGDDDDIGMVEDDFIKELKAYTKS